MRQSQMSNCRFPPFECQERLADQRSHVSLTAQRRGRSLQLVSDPRVLGIWGSKTALQLCVFTLLAKEKQKTPEACMTVFSPFQYWRSLQPKSWAPSPFSSKCVSSSICLLHFFFILFFFFAIRLAQQQTVTRLKQAANQSGVCQRPSTSWWGMAACSHIHVPIVGQGQGLLRRRRCLSAFGWFTGGKKNRDERRERLTGYLTWRHTAARLWFQSLQRIPLSDSGCTRRRQNIAGNITHTWQEEGEIKQMVFKLLSPTMCAT